jgi:cytoskeletal protein RodZ
MGMVGFPAETFGSRLRQVRQERGVSLPEISRATKISVSALEALERDDLARLPGGIFSRALVRGYAKAVGLDPELTVQDFVAEVDRVEQEAADAAGEHEPVAEENTQKSRVWIAAAGGAIVLALMISSAVTWMRARPSEPAAPETVPAPVNRTVSEEPPAAALGPARPPAPTPTPTKSPVVNSPLTIDIVANARCWVRVVADGKPKVSRTMAAGDREQVPADRELQITVGDTGAFGWKINGKPAKSLGAPGGVRTIHVTAENYTTFLQ